MATKVRLSLDFESCRSDLSAQICIKGVLTDTGVPAISSVVETLFYRDVAAKVGVNVPPCIYAGLDRENGNGVLVMRDIIASGGRFCSALVPFTPDEAAEGLDELARLHVAGWSGTALYEKPWMHCFLDRKATTSLIPLATLQSLLNDPRGDTLPADIRSAERLQRGIAGLASQVRTRPSCMVHGDAHAGNVYRDTQGALGIVDWQLLQRGEWAQDVSYHLAAF